MYRITVQCSYYPFIFDHVSLDEARKIIRRNLDSNKFCKWIDVYSYSSCLTKTFFPTRNLNFHETNKA